MANRFMEIYTLLKFMEIYIFLKFMENYIFFYFIVSFCLFNGNHRVQMHFFHCVTSN